MSEWSNHVLTCNEGNPRNIEGILRLYNKGEGIHLDPCYNKGAFWRGLPTPILKGDLNPRIPGVEPMDVRALPFDDHSIRSIMFDPPFVLKDTTNRTPNGLMETLYTGFKTYPMLIEFYSAALIEFHRVLVPDGLLIFKCMDLVSSGKQHWIHVDVHSRASYIGYKVLDLFINRRRTALMSPNMKNQKHARKNHSFYWVLRR